jgi:hypothetical protein
MTIFSQFLQKLLEKMTLKTENRPYLPTGSEFLTNEKISRDIYVVHLS